jgi:acetylglutamate kinase
MRVLLKLGGELLKAEKRDELEAIANDVAALRWSGHHLVLVHGGGPQLTALMRKLGSEPRIVGGRRVTDELALEALEMVVGGQLNIELVSALRGAGLSAVGLTGVSGALILCEKRPPAQVGDEWVDFGFVGDVTGVNVALLELLLNAGHVPVIACVAADARGRPYNINADTVANKLAESMKADRLMLITGTPGVLRDVDDPESRIGRLSIDEGRRAIAEGVVSGGMIPKLEESFESLARGVEQIHILGNLGPGDLVRAVEQPGSVGTALVA